MEENQEPKVSVLVVDDDKDSLNLCKTILERKGYDVIAADSGQKALDALEQVRPDVAILDVMMPEMNGYDLLTHMKMKPETQDIPIIMLTAKDKPQDMMEGYSDYGVEYYITKPFTTDQLVAGIKLVTS